MDRVVVATVNQSGKAMDHISIKCSYANPYSSNTVYIDRGAEQIRLTSEPDMSIVYEELRSCILRIGLLDSQLPKLPEGTVRYA